MSWAVMKKMCVYTAYALIHSHWRCAVCQGRPLVRAALIRHVRIWLHRSSVVLWMRLLAKTNCWLRMVTRGCTRTKNMVNDLPLCLLPCHCFCNAFYVMSLNTLGSVVISLIPAKSAWWHIQLFCEFWICWQSTKHIHYKFALLKIILGN